jgi:hemoglobin
MQNANDINTRKDIELLVDQFYGKVRKDEVLAPFFANIQWDQHLPVMYNFWSSILFGEQSYKGNPFQRHMALQLERVQFMQWLLLFHSTVDELFAGARAEEIKARAQAIAGVFQYKLNIIQSE